MILRSPTNLLRERGGEHDGRVAFVELFFDLVFVFAITQLAHTLLHHFTVLGALEVLILLLAVWWVWIFTTWVTNWLDPQKAPVHLVLFALMLAGLVMSMSIPDAFGERGLAFALAHTCSQVGRTVFMLWALAGRNRDNHRNFQRIICWLTTSAAVWVGGAFVEGEMRIAVWLIALTIEYAGPACGFWTPRMGRTPTGVWNISGAHMAERCGLFIIICLGESILVSGATFAEMDWSVVTGTAFGAAFVGTVAMWWVYFHIGQSRATHLIEGSSDPGRIARLAYNYLHIPIVAGIVLVAASDEFMLAHPSGHAESEAVIALVGGPALFLAGNLAFKWATASWPPLSHMVGLALLGASAVFSDRLPPVSLGATAAAILIIVAVWERVSLGAAGDIPPLKR